MQHTDPNPQPPPGDAPDDAKSHPRAPDLALELTGALPCVRCRYNLRGLSVAALCPECATPIRATILARVDPLAKELQPLHTPRLTALLLLLWTLAALLAAVASWVPRAIEGLERLGRDLPSPTWPVWATQAALVFSALGASALIRPHRLIPRSFSLAAVAAVALHIPLILVIQRIHAFDAAGISPYFDHAGIDPARAAWRLLMHAILLLIIFALRPNARLLTARSFVMRTGQIDRQTMLAMAAAVAVAALGDTLAILAGLAPDSFRDPLRVAALLFVGVGSLLVTLGLAGMLLDAIRLYPVLTSPPLALSDLASPSPRTPANNRP